MAGAISRILAKSLPNDNAPVLSKNKQIQSQLDEDAQEAKRLRERAKLREELKVMGYHPPTVEAQEYEKEL